MKHARLGGRYVAIGRHCQIPCARGARRRGILRRSVRLYNRVSTNNTDYAMTLITEGIQVFAQSTREERRAGDHTSATSTDDLNRVRLTLGV